MSTHSRRRPGSDTQGRSASAQSSPQPHSFETYATGMQAEASVPLRPPPGLEEEPAPDELDPDPWQQSRPSPVDNSEFRQFLNFVQSREQPAHHTGNPVNRGGRNWDSYRGYTSRHQDDNESDHERTNAGPPRLLMAPRTSRITRSELDYGYPQPSPSPGHVDLCSSRISPGPPSTTSSGSPMMIAGSTPPTTEKHCWPR